MLRVIAVGDEGRVWKAALSYVCVHRNDLYDSKKQCVVPFRFVDSAAGHSVTLKLFEITGNNLYIFKPLKKLVTHLKIFLSGDLLNLIIPIHTVSR